MDLVNWKQKFSTGHSDFLCKTKTTGREKGLFFLTGTIYLYKFDFVHFPDGSVGKEYTCNAGDTGETGFILG